jgi:predicted peptidase
MLIALVVGCSHTNPETELTGMPPNTGFILSQSHGAAGEHNYSVFIPRDYNPAQKYPTIVFLHGVGEAGSDGIGCTTVGLGPHIAELNGSFPFIVVFPQTGWDWCSSTSEQIMLDALTDAEKHYSIDQDRVSLTGMSSGGKGTWVLGARHPEIFSALVPMGGFSATDVVPQLKNYPIWALHNSGDFVVPVSGTRDMIAQIRAEGNTNVHYDEFDQGGHDCWDAAYAKGDLFNWMQTQRRMMH